MNCIHTINEKIILLKKDLSLYKKKTIDIEMEIFQMEQMIASFNENENGMKVLDTMVLNSKQNEIVNCNSRNILVVACPGSGKTHTVIARYINLVIKEKVDPLSIILITFTKKAGMEMNQRIKNILPNKIPYYVGSMHGLSYKLLQEYKEKDNLSKDNIIIIDEMEASVLLKRCTSHIIKENELLQDEIDIIQKNITNIYEKMSTSYPSNLNDIIKKTISQSNITNNIKNCINMILKKYEITKKEQNLVDFNDMMVSLCNMLGKNKMNQFLSNIKYIFFDEYQDINPIQSYILKKISTNSNVMVVGDDAQAIYAFRGSSVKYIWDFEKEYNDSTIFFLETNYRSTTSIVNFFQDTISHNMLQFKKNVTSNSNVIGIKPFIKCHSSTSEQYEWIVSDIIEKINKGALLKDIVILARKNKSLEMMEIELLKKNISVVKSGSISLLNKSHVKDFIAFLVITSNNKSTLHWKRVLTMHREIGMAEANNIVNMLPFSPLSHISMKLPDLHYMLTSLHCYKTKEQIYMILQYLIKIWKKNNERNIDEFISDINNIMYYIMDEDNVNTFINNLHLNVEIDTTDDGLSLSTIHSAKGLEWDHVYIVDMNNKDFPNIRHCFYKDEIECSEEERRLFYVACSRAKKTLIVTMHKNNDYNISPFVLEINKMNYIEANIMNKKLQYSGNMTSDINMYLQQFGYSNLIHMINCIKHTRSNIKISNVFPIILYNNTMMYQLNIICCMMKMLIPKIIQCNFPTITHGLKCSDTINSTYYKYIDKMVDWRDILNDIFYLATYKINKTQIEELIEKNRIMLISCEMIKYYENLEKQILVFLNKLKPKKINVMISANMKEIKSSIDMIINDNTMIEIRTSPNEICTFPMVSHLIMQGYLLKKQKYNIKDIIMINTWDGIIDSFNMRDFIENDYYTVYQKTLYE